MGSSVFMRYKMDSGDQFDPPLLQTTPSILQQTSCHRRYAHPDTELSPVLFIRNRSTTYILSHHMLGPWPCFQQSGSVPLPSVMTLKLDFTA